MKMRWIIITLVAGLVMPAGGLAQRKARTDGGGTKPVIEVVNTSHDFGEVYREDKYTHAFTVRNRGNADLVIEDVKPG